MASMYASTTTSARLGKGPSARHSFSVRSARPSPSRRFRVSAFKVTLNTPAGTQNIELDADTYILDAAEDAGLKLPFSCRAGACGTCVGPPVSVVCFFFAACMSILLK